MVRSSLPSSLKSQIATKGNHGLPLQKHDDMKNGDCQIFRRLRAWFSKRSSLKRTLGYAGLADDGLECANTQFGMVWNRDSNRCIKKLFLHHDMTTALPHLNETIAHKNALKQR